jgi:hypothetical protein
MSVRQALDYVCAQVGAQWRVNADGTLDAGLPDTVWGATATAFIARRAGASGTAPTPVEAVEIAATSSAAEFASKVIALGKGDGPNVPVASAGGTAPVQLWDGTTATMAAVVSADTTTSPAQVAAEQLALYGALATGADITVRLADPGKVLQRSTRATA